MAASESGVGGVVQNADGGAEVRDGDWSLCAPAVVLPHLRYHILPRGIGKKCKGSGITRCANTVVLLAVESGHVLLAPTPVDTAISN